MTKIHIQKEGFIKAHGVHTRKNHKPVMCITTGEIYASVLDAALANGVTIGAISWACCGKSKTCQGKRFCFVANVTEHLEEIAECLRIREAKAIAYDEICAKKEALNKAQAKYDHYTQRVADLEQQLKTEREFMLQAREELRALKQVERDEE
jgi:hypothetical protein